MTAEQVPSPRVERGFRGEVKHCIRRNQCHPNDSCSPVRSQTIFEDGARAAAESKTERLTHAPSGTLTTEYALFLTTEAHDDMQRADDQPVTVPDGLFLEGKEPPVVVVRAIRAAQIGYVQPLTAPFQLTMLARHPI
jgi:hypothetical protein